MLDIKFIRENADLVKKNLDKRNQPEKKELVDTILKHDKKWRFLKLKADKFRNQRNDLTAQIQKLKTQNKDADSKIKLAKEIPEKIKDTEAEMEELKKEIKSYINRIPNILHENVPKGDSDKDNRPFRFYGKQTKHDFELKPHGEYLEESDLADFDQAAKVAGSGFYYLKGDLALLDIAIQRYGIDFLLKKGFTLISPPITLNKAAISCVINFEDFRDVIYKIEGEDLYIIPTAEHTLVVMYKNKTLKKEDLPIKICALTPCFRKEIGSHGVDTRGLFRVHQFYKVEQVVLSTEEDSYSHLEEMQKISEDFFKSLKIPFRVIEICSGDLGPKMSKQYDIEAWFPRQNDYKEVTSAGNTTTYQAASLGAKYIDGEEKKYIHMLNNTMVATSRTIVAIIENFQKKDGTITIPKPLRRYMNGKRKIMGVKNA
ncbi:MAG: serine--tRNA ligase [Candidatus Woesearchaeota archaeon]